jgi:hypothetical protein
MRCKLNVMAAHKASQRTFSKPRVENRLSFSFCLIQAFGNSINGARCL